MLKQFFAGLDYSVIINALLSVIPAIICITLHELCHGLVAYRLGDDTAKNMGRLTLNPIKHIDATGILMMLVFKFGWAKPVPVDMRKFSRPKVGMALVAAAGPLSNIVLASFFLLIYGFIYYPIIVKSSVFSEAILTTVLNTAYLSTALAVFNIIPIPPLDGSKVVFSLLSDEGYIKLMRYERFGMIILVALMFFKLISKPLGLAVDFIFDKLFFFAECSFKLYMKLFVN